MRSISSILTILVILGAAGCGDPDVTELSCEVTLSPQEIDFGLVKTSETKRVTVNISSMCRSTVTVTGVDRSQSLSSAFRVTQFPTSIGPGGSIPVVVSFAPDELGAKDGKVFFRTDSKKTPVLELAVKGVGTESNVQLTPEMLTFPTVEVGGQATLPITLTNAGQTNETVTLLSLPQLGQFQLALPMGMAEIPLAAGESVQIPVTFMPQLAGNSTEFAEFKLCEDCSSPGSVTLKGTAIDSFVTVDPKDCLEFGFVNPGSSLTKSVSIGNLGTRSLSILEASIATGNGVFTLEPTELNPIEQNGHQVLNVTYKPTSQVSDNGSLKVVTDAQHAPSVNVCLHGTGGGPDVRVTPSALSFGLTAAGLSRDRTVRIENRGLTGAGADPTLSNLQILDAQILIPSGSSTQPGEFSVNWGVLPLLVGAGASKPELVTYHPVDDGDDLAILELTTNDADSPKVQVSLTGTGRTLAPCQLNIYPASLTLDFGVIAPNHQAQLQAVIENVGTDVCIIDSLGLNASTNAAFKLMELFPDVMQLNPGVRQYITVEFAPKVLAKFSGAIEFNVSDPANPHRQIELKGSAGTSCLIFAPEEINFGTVSAGCASSTRTVKIYNSCTSTIQIKSLTFAEDPANRFALIAAPTWPQSVTMSQSTKFDVRYVPRVEGDDRGGVFVQTDERAEPYLISFTGKAVNGAATQVDTWKQTIMPADILFVVDNSGSMGWVQDALAQNFSSFIAYAQEQNVDFHIAITTTDVDSNGTAAAPGKGNFSHPGNNPKVITPQTPNMMQVFTQNIDVGTGGSSIECGFEGAREALDPAKLATDNVDFLRDNAILSIIMLSDEDEQSPQSYNYYFAFFTGIKGFRNADMLTVSVVVSDTNPATSRYARMAIDTGGVIADLSKADWAKDLARISLFAFGRRNHFILTSTPADPTLITCDIDNVDVPRSQGTIDQWSYAVGSNAIDFNPISMPEPDQLLTCRYPVACIP